MQLSLKTVQTSTIWHCSMYLCIFLTWVNKFTNGPKLRVGMYEEVIGISLVEIHIAHITYRTRAIITRGLYIFTPIFSAVYNQERLILQTS